jgi:hypothetical protein
MLMPNNMKKQLLLGIALLGSTLAFSQNTRVKPQPAGAYNMAERIAQKFATESAEPSLANKPGPQPASNINDPAPAIIQESSSQPASLITWKLLSGSSNCYGQLLSNSRPLQYNPDVNTVSFIHRKSFSYSATPAVPATATSGVILADISSNWGVNWDSTAIWTNPTNWARYPQGIVYTPPVPNNTITNAYVIGSGPCTNANSLWGGSWYASKQLAVPGSTLYNNATDQTPGAQQFVSNTGTFAPGQSSYGWPRFGASYSSTSGAITLLGQISDDNTASSAATQKMRGVAIIKGTFNAGVFNWAMDSIIPSTIVTTSTVKVLSSTAQMAFNKKGDVGYIVMIGAKSGATLENKGYQPIIYKTTNAGGSWSSIPSIDFSSPSMSVVPYHLAPINTNSNISAPYFNEFDIVVDINNNLHIGALIISQNNANNDSLNYISQFTMSINPGNKYLWGHVPGNRPYLYDFYGDGSSPWKVITVDSLSTEDPGAAVSSTGYNSNPWDATGTGSAKINIESRPQLGRTPDGNYITYSYSESDTNFVVNAQKWNVLPNIKTRCLAIGLGAGCQYTLSPVKINVSRPAVGSGTVNPKVSDKAFLHYMSPVTGSAVTLVAGAGTTVDINTPFTVTNSSPLGQLTNNSNWYGSAKLTYTFNCITVGAVENSKSNAYDISLFPNPANNNATLGINLKENTGVTVNVYNLVGQLVKSTKADGRVGDNNINIDLNNLSAGVYMVNVKVGNSVNTTKLIIQ